MRSESRRQSQRRSRYLNGIDLWALLPVELVLLIVFMLQGGFPHHQPPLDLPLAEHASAMPGAIREDAMVVTVTRDGNIFFGPRLVKGDDLSARVAESVRNGAERKVYLKVDARAKYGDTEVAIEQVRHAGVSTIGIVTERPFRRQR